MTAPTADPTRTLDILSGTALALLCATLPVLVMADLTQTAAITLSAVQLLLLAVALGGDVAAQIRRPAPAGSREDPWTCPICRHQPCTCGPRR